MPFSSSMLDVCVPASAVPPDLNDFVQVTALYSDAVPYSHSLSRRTMASEHLDELLSTFRATDLYYLREPVSAIDGPAVARAIDALERLFDQIRRDPARALTCTVRECSVQQLVDAASGPEVIPVPSVVNDDEEGETLPYVLAYLKAHMVVLRHALTHGLTVVHGQSHRLDGSEVTAGG
jgi:hypothetical protein